MPTIERGRIRLTLEGPASEGGHLRLEDLVQELGALRQLLDSTQKLLSGEAPITYRVVELSHSSPSVAAVDPSGVDVLSLPVDLAAEVPARLFDLMDEVKKHSRLPAWATSQLGSQLATFVAPIGTRIPRGVLESLGRSIELGPGLHEKVTAILAQVDTCDSVISGRFKALNLESKPAKFWLYPVAGPSRVMCLVPDELKATAFSTVDKERVSVEGEFYFRPGATFPFKIEVSSIETLPESDRLPSLLDLQGAVRLEPPMKSEDAVRKVRDEWD